MQTLKNALSKKGFDIHILFSSKVYNDYLSTKGLLEYQLPFQDSRCMLVGNTKKMWPCFIKESNGQTLDSWTASEIIRVTNQCLSKFSIYFVFDDYIQFKDEITRGQKRIAFQSLGQSIGFSVTIPGTGLSVARDFGPWFAFRAVIVFHDLIEDEEIRDYDEEIATLANWINQSIGVDELQSIEQKTQDALSKKDTKELIKVRQEIGILLNKKDYEYDFNQMMYHYTKSKEYLKM